MYKTILVVQLKLPNGEVEWLQIYISVKILMV